VLLFTGVIYLRVNHVGPIMGEEEAEEIAEAMMILLTAIDNRMELHWRVQERIASTLERLLKIMEMRP